VEVQVVQVLAGVALHKLSHDVGGHRRSNPLSGMDS
jgi:hypothetical protein